MTVKYYWEDLAPGRVFESEPRTLSAKQMVDFALEYDPQYYHTDEQAARSSPYGGLIASGFQTAAVGMRLICDSYLRESSCVGSPGVEEVLEQTPSQKMPNRGTVRFRWELFNQKDEVACSMTGRQLFLRRTSAQ